MDSQHPSSQLRLVTVEARKRKRRDARISLIIALTAAMIVTGVYVASASHNFSDVPTSAFYHDAVEWIVTRAITAGCAVGLYCPNDPVTRGTMAVFLRALGMALTPVAIYAVDGFTALDPDVSPIICTTANYSPPFPQRILAKGSLSILSGGPMNTRIILFFSADAGATWDPMIPIGWPRAGHGGAGFWYHATDFAPLDLFPGNTYKFGIQVQRESGTADAANYECEFLGEIVNRTPEMPGLPNR